MERVLSFSFDDLWVSLQQPSSTSSPKSNLNRSSSDWSFQRFLEQIPCVDSSDPSLNADNDSITNNDDQVVEVQNPRVFPPSFQTSDPCNNHNDLISIDEDEVVEIENPTKKVVETQNPKNFRSDTWQDSSFSIKIPRSNATIIDPDEYQAMLRRNLEIELASAAVALSPATLVKTEDSVTLVDNRPYVSDVQTRFQGLGKESGCSFSMKTDQSVAAPLSLPALPSTQKELPVQSRTTTNSASSRDKSDDEDLQGESKITNNTDPSDEKHIRKKQSNRESARRSRERRQAQMDELAAQVAQLTADNSALSTLLTDTNQKYKEAVVDNRILRATMETLRAKVIMAEDMMQRQNRSNQMFPTIFEVHNMPTQLNATSSVAAEYRNQDIFQQSTVSPPNDHGMMNKVVAEFPPFPSVEEIQNCSRHNKMGRTPSMHRVTSLEHLKKRVRGGQPNS